MTRVLFDSSVLIRYFAEDDIPRAAAAAALIESDARIVLSTGVLLETIHVLRTQHAFANPALAMLLLRFLQHPNVELVDADKSGVMSALSWTTGVSARRISDAIIAESAHAAGADYIATFDERMSSPGVPVRLI